MRIRIENAGPVPGAWMEIGEKKLQKSGFLPLKKAFVHYCSCTNSTFCDF
jgi:hypothetical protein